MKFPKEIREIKAWVCWRYESRGNKATKVPVNPLNGKNASCSDLSTWSDYDQAVEKAENDKTIDGIGFVFSEDNPYCGIDLDNARNPDTGILEPWADEIVMSLDSYTEVSPSRTGLHIIVKGKLPKGGKRKGNVEMYDKGRYFTMTGDVLDDRNQIEERQVELEKIHRETFAQKTNEAKNNRQTIDLSDGELLDKMFSAKNGNEIRALYEGDWEGSYHSQSEADLALCSHLAFYLSKQPDRIEDLFRGSGLYREKWERKDYRDSIISKAIESQSSFYKGPLALLKKDKEPKGVPEVMSLDELLATPKEKNDMVIEGLLPVGGGLVIGGESGVGKSLLSNQLAISLASGKPFLGNSILKPRRVLIIQLENKINAEQERFKKMLEGYGIGGSLPISFYYPENGFNIKSNDDCQKLEEIIKDYGSDVVILDPFSCAYSGDENDNIIVRRALDKISRVCQKCEASLIVVHHIGKPSKDKSKGKYSLRGASSIADWADAIIMIGKGKGNFTISFPKVRNGKELSDKKLKRDDKTLLYIPTGKPEKVRAAIEDSGGRVEGQKSLIELLKKDLTCSASTARDMIKEALECGAIKSETSLDHKQRMIYMVA